jgi:hypothetical protein
MFKKRPNFLNNSPTSIEDALRLLSAPSGRFLQQTAICPVSLRALVVELHRKTDEQLVHVLSSADVLLIYFHTYTSYLSTRT